MLAVAIATMIVTMDSSLNLNVEAFSTYKSMVPSGTTFLVDAPETSRMSSTRLFMAGKKKRRRRKSPPPSPSITQSDDMEQEVAEINEESDLKPSQQLEETSANFDLTADAMVINDISTNEIVDNDDDKQFVLPDIRGVIQKKEEKRMEEELMEEKESKKKRISRKDTDAFIKLMESEPFGDADPENFEEEYDTVSALLGEGSKSFVGIPPGPLQVGHFVGALGIVLMAFVEYPGFPLTNLPSPLRGALQGGLGTIYAINIVMAIFATFQATERGQSKLLWGMKTFAVGGLAFDQLNQLPTLKEIEDLQNKKGARSFKNLKKKNR